MHPYRRGVIGSIEDLDAATLDDVRAFHRTFYRPDNAMLIVAGDFDPQQLDAWIDKYFGAIAAPGDADSPRRARRSRRTRDARVRETGPNVPLPAVAITWLGPPARSPDAAALQRRGGAARQRRVVAPEPGAGLPRRRSRRQASFGADLRVDPGLLVAYAIAAERHSAGCAGARAEGGDRSGSRKSRCRPRSSRR